MNLEQALQIDAIIDARRRSIQFSWRAVVEEERSIKEEMGDIANQRQNLRQINEGDTMAYQKIGGEVLWLTVLSRRHNQLQQKLSSVMARKADLLRQLKIANGRHEASSAIVAIEKQAGRRQKQLRYDRYTTETCLQQTLT